MSLAALAIVLVLVLVSVAAAAAFAFARRRPAASAEAQRIAALRAQGRISANEERELLAALRLDAGSAVVPNRRPDNHLRVVSVGLLVLGVVVGGFLVLQALATQHQLDRMGLERSGFSAQPPGGSADLVTPPGASFPRDEDPFARMRADFGLVLLLVGVAGAIFGAMSIVGGVGLLAGPPGFRRLARAAAIGCAAVCLLGFPIGTLFGAYALWVLAIRADAGAYF